MRPYGLDEYEQLRLAHARAQELRQSWHIANGVRQDAHYRCHRARPGILRVAAEAAGRTILALGQLIPRG